MEFKYNTKSVIVRSIYMLVFSFFLLMFLIISLFNLKLANSHDLLIMIIIFVIFCWTLYKHFQKLHTVVIVNDQEICLKNFKNGKITKRISWEEVVSIDDNIYKLSHLFNLKRVFFMVLPGEFSITVNSLNQRIVIFSYLEEVNKLIKFMKDKVNDIFDTKNILYKYKT